MSKYELTKFYQHFPNVKIDINPDMITLQDLSIWADTYKVTVNQIPINEFYSIMKFRQLSIQQTQKLQILSQIMAD